MIGLGGREGASNYFVFLSILFIFASLMNQQMAMFASFASEGKLQVFSAVTLFIAILFSGYIVPLDTIPNYYLPLYWLNPFSWAFNALVVNEAYSGRWEEPEFILAANGFVKEDGVVPDQSWIGWGITYMIVYWLICLIGTALGFTYSRAVTTSTAPPKKPLVERGRTISDSRSHRIEIPFKPLTLSFQNLGYEVTASTTNDRLKLLKGVSGIFRPGRMCALMGSSGAG